jgi:hypothetical protein
MYTAGTTLCLVSNYHKASSRRSEKKCMIKMTSE